jgi:uncharacterized protein (DUF488 family)
MTTGKPTAPFPFFTLGHSTRSLEEFVALLRSANIHLVADVRTVPRSRTNPQFNRDTLPQSLSQFQIGYEHISALGGLRGTRRDVPPRVNAFWQNQNFHNYADYAMGNDFRAGLRRLLDLGHHAPTAIMCAEAVWWRCHRRIIADYLIAAGETVFHVLAPHRIEPARISSAAKLGPENVITYPAAAQGTRTCVE